LAAALQLEGALRDVVRHAVPGDVLKRLLLVVDVPRRLPDHDAQLDLPVRLLASPRDEDGVVGTDDAVGGLHEHDRFRRNRHSRFLRVVGVVEADADHLPGPRDRSADPLALRVDRRQVSLGGERLQPLDAPAFEERAVEVAGVRRDVQGAAVREKHRGLLLADFADAQELHGSISGTAGDYSPAGGERN
jgi:hypothetical protein